MPSSRTSTPRSSPPRSSPPRTSPPRTSPPRASPPRASPPRASPPRVSPPRKTPSPEAPARYRVFRCEYLGNPNHEAVFVETHENGADSGHLYHVVGNILTGMRYEEKPALRPESSASFDRKEYLGTIAVAYLGSINQICRTISVPGSQVDLKGRRLYPGQPLRRCGEWTADAVNELRARGVLQ
jgi:hypothetical protein